MPILRDIPITLDDIEIRCKPTLAKIAEIEQRFGPGLSIVDRFGKNGVAFSEMVEMVAIMVRGVPNAPPPKTVREVIFDAGVMDLAPKIVEFILAAITVDEPAGGTQAAEGN